MSILDLRIVKDMEGLYTIRECVWTEEGELELIGTIPAYPHGKTPEQLLDDMSLIAEAFQKEVIHEEDIEFDEEEMSLEGFYEAPEGYH